MNMSFAERQQRLEQHFEQASVNIRKLREHIIKHAAASGIPVVEINIPQTEVFDFSGFPVKS